MKTHVVSKNPLRDPADRRLPRIPEPCTLVIFGASGDLARHKLIPAIYDLSARGLLPPAFALLGVARRDWGHGDFAELAKEAAQAGCRTPWRQEVWDRLAEGLRFVGGSFEDDATMDTVAKTLTELDGRHGTASNAAFYLAIPPATFPKVLSQLERTGLSRPPSGAWRRVVAEKPFGYDLSSARALNRLVEDVFQPNNVFRIDHYLGKETVQNLLALRFANTMFEPIWNSLYVDSVQITMAEDVGIGTRASFYDRTGAARDVLQNHLLQLLALTAMEEPVSLDSEAIRLEKIKVLRAISLPSDLHRYAIRGQYIEGWCVGDPVVGYQDEDGIPAGSTTETYAAVRLNIETRRWAGVPFYVRCGKRLPKRVTEIALLLKRTPHVPFAPTETELLGHNQLVIRIQPDEGISVKFGSKVPGSPMEVRDVAMDFLYGEAFTASSPTAYERLVLDVLLGDATLFPRAAEVEASWEVIDFLEAFWKKQKPETYEAGAWGPAGATAMLAHDGRLWRRP